jgi:hypothetical protein
MQPCSHDRSALRLAPTALAARHHAGLRTLARISLGLSEPALAPEAALAHRGLVSPNAAVTDVVAKPLAAGVSWTVRISRHALKSLGEPERDAPKRSLDHFSMATGDPIPPTDCKFSVWRMPAPRTNGDHATVNGDQEPRRVM